MTPEPRVTVVMAVHNGEAVVDAAIASIADQTYDRWELVIVDDGSIDMTPRILRSWAEREERVRVVGGRPRAGLGQALNRGIGCARGHLIARADADDVSFPTRLQKQVQFLDARPGVAVVGTGAELVDEGGRNLGTALLPEDHHQIEAHMYRQTPFIHSTVLMRRAFLERLGGYDPRLRRAQDSDLWLRGYRRFRYHNLPEPLVRYRVRARLSMEAIFVGAFVLARAAYREDRLLSRGGYALRFLVATLLSTTGLRQTRLR